MAKYILITIVMTGAMLGLAYKQAPHEPEVARPVEDAEEIVSDIPQTEEGEPVVSEFGNIRVTRPQLDAQVASPLLVKGSAKASASVLHLRLKGADGTVIVEKQATVATAGEDAFGSFGELLLFENAPAGAGSLEVYSEGAFGGGEQDLVSIPIKF